MNVEQIFDCEVENINKSDSPDFVDAFISRAFYRDGWNTRELTEKELEELNENREFIYRRVVEYLY